MGNKTEIVAAKEEIEKGTNIKEKKKKNEEKRKWIKKQRKYKDTIKKVWNELKHKRQKEKRE